MGADFFIRNDGHWSRISLQTCSLYPGNYIYTLACFGTNRLLAILWNNCPSVRGGDPGKSILDRGVADPDFCTIRTGQDIDIIRGYRDLDVIQPPWRTNLPRKFQSSRASSFGVSSMNYRSRSKTDMIGSTASVCPTCVVKLCTMDPSIHNSQSFRDFLM